MGKELGVDWRIINEVLDSPNIELEELKLIDEINQFATEITWNESSGSIIIANDKTTNYITKINCVCLCW